MATVRPFRAVRPTAEYAAEVAALPYDVMSSREATEMVTGKPNSFLHVDKAEIDLPEGTDLYSEEVYMKAKENLGKLISSGVCVQDSKPCFYIYRQIMNGRVQNGITACVSIDDYINNAIKKHELTRADKEADRINHVDYCDANTGPIFLAYRPEDKVRKIINNWQESHIPYCDFTTDDGIGNAVWVIDDENTISEISALFDGIDCLYIADGHHRAASAVKVGLMRRSENPGYTGEEEFNYFLAVLFSSDELAIMDYNRVIKDTNDYSKEDFIKEIGARFDVEKADASPYKPEKRHTFGMYIDNEWYKLSAKEAITDETDPVASLDVSILQDNLIAPVLDIEDPRTDKRIDFVGGIRGLEELEKRCNDDMCIAFSMFPTSLDELMKIADAGELMPPKSTWFEPKLLSGLFIHLLK